MTETSHSETQPGWNPTNVAAQSYLTQPSSSRTTELEGGLSFQRQPVQDSGRTTTGTSSSQSQSQSSLPAPSDSNTRSGFFAGSSHVDASHGTFNYVGRDQYIYKIETKENEMSPLNKLRRAKDAGYRSEHHQNCLPGTRNAELERIKKWEVDPADKRVYWLNGLAGTGKSTIAQTFAECSSTEGRLGASFFCSRDFPDRRNIHLIFPTIAFGLAQRHAQFREALMEVMSSSPDAADESLAIQLEDLLVRPLKSTKLSTTIIIDALDECEDDEPASAILSLLARYIDAIPSVKFFITGRPEVPIRTGFRLPLLQTHTKVFVLHDVDQSSVNRDIEHYLRTRLSEIASSRGYSALTEPWPADEDIAFLVKQCSGLFIVASIITRIIGDNHVEPRRQLKVVIREADSTVRGGRFGVDETYRQVFLRSVVGVDILDTYFFDLLRLVVGSIVLVFSPLSCADLAKLLDVPQEEVRSAIHLLHSVLIVPDSNTRLLRICHKSFADFLTDPSRCVDRRFYVERYILHKKLGIRCLRLVMNGSLKRNICDLPPYAMNKDINDLDARREKYIGGGLEYACRTWAKHLCFASRDGDDVGNIVGLLECFFRHYLLSWLEVLSIVGDMRCAVYSLRDMRGWLTDVGAYDTNLLDIIKDSERFILRFFDVIEASPCHLYHSALPWSPRSSLVRALYQDQISTEVSMLNAIDDSWDASMRIIQARDDMYCITFSHDDHFIAVGGANFVEVFETLTGHRRTTFIGPENVGFFQSLSFSLDDTLIVTGHGDGTIIVWDLQTGGLVCTLVGHTQLVESVAFSPCGTMIASCSRDHTVRIWSVPLRDCRCVLKGHSDVVRSVYWSATRNEVISGSHDKTVRVWDITGERCVKTFSGHVHEVVSVACSADSLFIASGSTWAVKIFNMQTGDVVRTISTDDWVSLTQFLDQDTVAYVTEQALATFVIHDLTNTPTPKSNTWLKRCLRKARSGLELLQSQMRHSKTNPTNDANVLVFKYRGYSTAISSDGSHVASKTSNNAVTVWQTDGPSPNRDTASHYGYVGSVAFSKDGQLIASGSNDQTDSTLVASVTDTQTIRIWDTRTHDLISTFTTPSPFGMRFPVGLSPNGDTLVCLCLVKHLRVTLWEVATGKLLASMKVDRSFEKVAFGVDGTSVSLESDDLRMRYRVSPIRSLPDNDKDEHPPPPMEFVPLYDTQPSASSHQPSGSSDLYRHQRGSAWIVDEQERRVLWVPPDLRHSCADSYGEKVVLGSQSGRVAIVHFSDNWY